MNAEPDQSGFKERPSMKHQIIAVKFRVGLNLEQNNRITG